MDMQSECREGYNLGLKGLGPKAFRSGMHDAWLPQRFWAPKDVIKYTIKELLDIAT
jgi:hypothetical protein